MSFSFFKKESKEEPPLLEKDKTLKLTKEDVLKIREELKRYENYEQKRSQKKATPTYSRERKREEKAKERNQFLNVAIFVVVILLGIMAYAVLNW